MRLWPKTTPWGMPLAEIPLWAKFCLCMFFLACFLGSFKVFGESSKDYMMLAAFLFGGPPIIMINWWGINRYMKTKND